MGPYAINSEQVAPGAITTAGASLDLVTLIIKDEDTIPAQSQASNVQMPEGVQSIQPYEAIQDVNTVMVDNPSRDLSYRVEGKARGSGVILGWYPSRNGHLLRYQTSRALRGIVCSAIDVTNIDFIYTCDCVVDDDDDDGISDTTCDCTVTSDFVDVDFEGDFQCGGCTVIDCDSPNATEEDPMCTVDAEDDTEGNRMDPFDDDDGDELPDRCNPYTSVSDVTNPQEGTPVYSPSIESITIDDEGRVEMRFFGRGSIDPTGYEDIEITVVVLLDDQYGA
eukprot:CAMPEP_0206196748 /NCGR_PEP_ID=MMETSP0166-20121206/8641_1 /ASSEMBLY_ACC=CAM_ASM_000260 /TAXON_ID=95228 /ORGANISM="Vannella robusta, Strain DIVA3 518/3/11/1/6" /LENGTH=278 /DNA_ID=CAMNT_0053614299 /DNA_START=227 /DNA_END=1063 /DNA_ORIENTATION=-